jgi:hypothetical protein
VFFNKDIICNSFVNDYVEVHGDNISLYQKHILCKYPEMSLFAGITLGVAGGALIAFGKEETTRILGLLPLWGGFLIGVFSVIDLITTIRNSIGPVLVLSKEGIFYRSDGFFPWKNVLDITLRELMFYGEISQVTKDIFVHIKNNNKNSEIAIDNTADWLKQKIDNPDISLHIPSGYFALSEDNLFELMQEYWEKSKSSTSELVEDK